MESTSVDGEILALTLVEHGLQVSVVNPAKIKCFARSLWRRGKTDALDGELIAQYGTTMRPACWTPPGAARLDLRALVRSREAIVQLLTLEKGRRHAMSHHAPQNTMSSTWSDERLHLLERQLEQATQAISELVTNSCPLKSQVKRLATGPGVGLLTAAILRCETMNLNELHRADQWATWAGLSPSLHHANPGTLLGRLGSQRSGIHV